jgi:hypothetical protein
MAEKSHLIRFVTHGNRISGPTWQNSDLLKFYQIRNAPFSYPYKLSLSPIHVLEPFLPPSPCCQPHSSCSLRWLALHSLAFRKYGGTSPMSRMQTQTASFHDASSASMALGREQILLPMIYPAANMCSGHRQSTFRRLTRSWSMLQILSRTLPPCITMACFSTLHLGWTAPRASANGTFFHQPLLLTS